MDKKEIQEKRMKEYFIQATKDILKGEGLKAVSVRNIADKAGYSYATLYNYFKDAKDLVFECVKDFQEECTMIVISETEKSPRGFQKIKAITMSYIKYFVQYPGIFELFFVEKIYDLASKQPTIEMINTFLDRLCQEEWDYCLEQHMVLPEVAEMKKSQLRYVVAGILLFYLTRRNPHTYKEFLDLAELQVSHILGH